MSYTRPYLRLPVNPDEGFPQAFLLEVSGRLYAVTLAVSVVDDDLLAPGAPLVLPLPGAYLVMTVAREGQEAAQTLLRRKLVTGHEYEAAELAFVFTEMVVDPRNLNGAGAFGSSITGGVAARWAS